MEGLAAIGGWVTVALLPDGSTRWYGHAHNSGADNYDFVISAIIRGSTGAAIASRDHDWDEWHPPHEIIVNEFGHFLNAQLESTVHYASDIGSALESGAGS